MREYVEKAGVFYHNINGPRVNKMCQNIVQDARKEVKTTIDQIVKEQKDSECDKKYVTMDQLKDSLRNTCRDLFATQLKDILKTTTEQFGQQFIIAPYKSLLPQ